MFLGAFSNAHKPFSVIIDIGSGSVGVGIVDVDAAFDKPYLVYTHREHIRTPKDISAAEYLRALKEALLAATLELSSHGMKLLHEQHPHAHLSTIHVLYAAPWTELISRNIRLEKTESFHATHEVVQELVDSALKQARAQTHEETLFEETGLEIIQQQLVDGRLNGYPVANFNGQECITIDVVHLSELVPHAVRQVLSDAGKNLVPHPTLTEHTFASVFVRFAQRTFPHMDSFLTIELAGGGTEAVIVQNDVLRENVSSLFGTHAFEQEIADTLGTIVNEVRSHIRDFLQHTTREDVSTAIQAGRERYKKHLQKLIAELQTRYALPTDVLVLADPEFSDLFNSLVEEVYGTVVPVYKIHSIDTSFVSTLVEYADGTAPDQYLAMSALFFHTQQKKPDAEI